MPLEDGMAKAANKILANDLIDVRGAAQMISVSPKTIMNWLAQGRLTRLKAGGRTLVRKSEVLSQVKVA